MVSWLREISSLFQWYLYRGFHCTLLIVGEKKRLSDILSFLSTLTVMRAKTLLQSCHDVVYSRGFFLYPRTDGRSLAEASSATPTEEEEEESKMTTPTYQQIILSQYPKKTTASSAVLSWSLEGRLWIVTELSLKARYNGGTRRCIVLGIRCIMCNIKLLKVYSYSLLLLLTWWQLQWSSQKEYRYYSVLLQLLCSACYQFHRLHVVTGVCVL